MSMRREQRVLVAHCNPEAGGQIAAWLKAAGAIVHRADDGTEALAAAEMQSFALSMVSASLTGINGFDLCRKLSHSTSTRSSIPVVLLADVIDPFVRARARHVGARAVLCEPTDEQRICSLLSEIPAEAEMHEGEDWNADVSGEASDRLLKDLLHGDNTAPSNSNLMDKLTDPLTGLINEEFFRMKLAEEIKRSGRHGQPLTLLTAEVDNFDELVSRHGTSAGDEALLEVAGVFLCESRDIDVAGRVGPSRFQLLMPNTDRAGGKVVAERVKEGLAERQLEYGDQKVSLKVSLGVATASQDAEDVNPDQIVAAAEAQLAIDRGSLARPL